MEFSWIKQRGPYDEREEQNNKTENTFFYDLLYFSLYHQPSQFQDDQNKSLLYTISIYRLPKQALYIFLVSKLDDI